MWQREHDGEATTSRSGTFFAEAIRVLILIVAEQVLGMAKRERPFKGRQFTSEVILWAVRWYLQFPISYRDLELMLRDRGVPVDHTTPSSARPERPHRPGAPRTSGNAAALSAPPRPVLATTKPRRGRKFALQERT